MVTALAYLTAVVLFLGMMWQSGRSKITCRYCGGCSRNWARRHAADCPYAGTGL